MAAARPKADKVPWQPFWYGYVDVNCVGLKRRKGLNTCLRAHLDQSEKFIPDLSSLNTFT